MSKIESDDFKYDIPENSKYDDQLDYEGEMQLVHEDEDEDLWNEVSDESFDDENNERKKDGYYTTFRKKSYKRPSNKLDRKMYFITL